MASCSPLLLVLLSSCTFSLTTQKELNCSNFMPHHAAVVRDSLQARGDKFSGFDWALTKELHDADAGNFIASPISLKIVLAMLYEGASGQTAQEISEALNLDNDTSGLSKKTRERFSLILKSLEAPDGKNKVKIGTHVFIDKNTQPKEHYQCSLKHYYNSAMEKVDFSNTTAAITAINAWASNVTEGHIQHLVSEAEAHASTIMLLLNAVYFKGIWKVPFPENQTYEGPFHLNEKQSVKVPLMNTTDTFYYWNITDLDAQMIKLPYLGEKFSMYVVLPYKKNGLDTLAKKLGPNKSLKEYQANMVAIPVNLILPRFEFHFTTGLRPILEKLNIKTMFTPEAELSKIANTRSGGLVVSNVLQKAGISVAENGTVAYAATVVELMDKFGGAEDVVQFKADHPFLFFIEDESVKTTLFVGKVTNPGKPQVTEDRLGISDPETVPETPVTPGNKQPYTPGATDNNNYPPTSDPEKIFDPDQEAIQAKFNFFDSNLVEELAHKDEGNFIVSPTSIKTLLGLIVEGAEGSTHAEILRVLRLPQNITYARRALSSLQNSLQSTASQKVTIDSVAQVFIANTLKTNSTYEKILKDHYKANVSPYDFTSPSVAANNINSWIRTRTKGLISELVDEDMINSHTYAILTSAIYFDGKWRNEFKTSSEECFYSEPNLQCHMVPMMFKNEEMNYKFDQSLDSHVLQIPYQDDRISMIVVMPRRRDGMKQLTIDAVRLSFPRVLDMMNLFEVNLKMPRFSMDYGTELINTLKKLGLNEVFDDSAQLPYMINGRQSRVSAIVHKAKIDVTEKGTKAGAATGAAVVPLMFGLGVINLELNHPFYFFIYDGQSQTVLFAGRLSTLGDAPAPASSSQPSAVPLGAGSGNQRNSYSAPGSSTGANYQPANANPGANYQPANANPGANYQPANANPGAKYQPANTNPEANYQPGNANGARPSYPGQPTYPPKPFGQANQPKQSYANEAASESAGTPVADGRPSYQVGPQAAGPKPSNHGVQNYQYNPQASRATAGPLHYPESTDDKWNERRPPSSY